MTHRICQTPDCGKPEKARRMCGPHYEAWAAANRGLVKPRKQVARLTLEARLIRIGWTVTDAGCWEWAGARFRTGYGQVSTPEQGMTTVHRAAYKVWIGPIPEGYLVCHRCDNRPCMNPSHLFLGTDSDNVQDMTRKGRHGHAGSEGAESAWDDIPGVFALHERGVSYSKIASRYSCEERTIGRILKSEWAATVMQQRSTVTDAH